MLLVSARLPVLPLALGAAVEGDLAFGAGLVLENAGHRSLRLATVGAVAARGRSSPLLILFAAIIPTATTTVPPPSLHHRRFVLLPAEISPSFRFFIYFLPKKSCFILVFI